jgi:polysaccharide biosynthesis protein VpsQ
MQPTRWFLFFLFSLFLMSIIIANDLGQIKSIVSLVNSLPFGDKFGHVIFIGTLTYLLNYALADSLHQSTSAQVAYTKGNRLTKIGNYRILLGCLIIAVVMTIEEFSQIWIPNRTFDLGDLAANYLGISIAGWIRIRQKSS